MNTGKKTVSALLVFCAALFLFSCVALPDNNEIAKEYHSLANAWFEMGKLDKAEAAYSKALLLNPALEASAYNLARMKTEARKFGEAQEIIEKLLGEDPENTKILVLKAYIEYQSGKLEAALETGTLLLTLLPDDPDTLFNHAIVLESLKKNLEAREIFKRLHLFKPTDRDVLFHLASIEASFENWKDAISFLEMAIANEAKSARIYDAYASYLGNANEYAKALDACNDGIKVAPEDKNLWFRKAELELTVIEDGKTGLESLKKALSSGFIDKERIDRLLKNERLLERDSVSEFLKVKNLLPETMDSRSGTENKPEPTGNPNP